MKKKDKKKVKNTFRIPEPNWEGPEFLSTRAFFDVFKKYRIGEKSYIHINEVGPFLEDLFEGAEIYSVTEHMKTKYLRDYTFYLEHSKETFISLRKIRESLKICRFNFLKSFRGRKWYTTNDLIKIWCIYDTKLTGSIGKAAVEAFSYDLLTTNDQKYDINIVQQLATELIKLYGDRENETLSFNGMSQLLPSSSNLLKMFPERERVSREDFEKGFSYFDQYGSDLVGGDDLTALLKDVFQQINMDDSEESIKTIREALLSVLSSNKDGKVKRTEVALLLSH